MSTLQFPVELPTARHSFVEFPMTANIHDPTSWNLVQNDGTYSTRSSKNTVLTDYTSRAFGRLSTRPSSNSPTGTRLKHPPSLEASPQELEAQPFPSLPPRQSSAHSTIGEQLAGQTTPVQELHSEREHPAPQSADSIESSSSVSTAGTNSIQERQVYTVSAGEESKRNAVDSPVLGSARLAGSSIRKAAVPTSKYKKKAPPSLRASSVKRQQSMGDIETPLGSPMSTYTAILQSPGSTAITTEPLAMPSELPSTRTPTHPAELPVSITPTSATEAQAHQGQAPLQHAKSTVSVRKARALHSHPSLPSMKDETTSLPPLPQQSPNLAILRHKKSQDTVRSRPSFYDLQQPSPAPNTPLPDLPPGIAPLSRPPSSRDTTSYPSAPPDVHIRPVTSSSAVAPTLRRQETTPQSHTEMANFMTSSSKVIFRRFHDVHIRLLLTLQDEISVLEKELAELDHLDDPLEEDLEVRRIQILTDLRRLLAEYDHLFSNWNLMQSSKADTQTTEELKQFIKRSGLKPGSPMSSSAMTDLLWIKDHSEDLSCIHLNAKKDAAKSTRQEVPVVREKSDAHGPSERTRSEKVGQDGGGNKEAGAGGFMALFSSCAGKRK